MTRSSTRATRLAVVVLIVTTAAAALLGHSVHYRLGPIEQLAVGYVYDTSVIERAETYEAAPSATGLSAQIVGGEEGIAPSAVFAGRAPTALSSLTYTPRVAGAADDAFTHGYSYHPRIRARGLQDPVGHNFPYSYDDVILRSTPVRQADGSLLYRTPGSINGKDGFFEIALNPDTGTIFHRTFVGG